MKKALKIYATFTGLILFYYLLVAVPYIDWNIVAASIIIIILGIFSVSTMAYGFYIGEQNKLADYKFILLGLTGFVATLPIFGVLGVWAVDFFIGK